MSLLTIAGLSFEFTTGTPLFSGLSFSINPSDRIALVGANGSGKSTVLALLRGELQPASGSIVRRRDLRISYAGQDLQDSHCAQSLFEYVLAASQYVAELRGRLAQTDCGHVEYAALINEYHDAGGYLAEAEVSRVLAGLGFDEAVWDNPVQQLSGGEWSRANLARALSIPSDLVLLDEPSNHLDRRARTWLYEELANRDGASVIATHDRELLSSFARRVVEVERGRARVFEGDFEFFRAAQETLAEQEWADYEAFTRRKAAMEAAAQKRDRLAVKVATAPPGVRHSKDFYARKASKVAQTGRMLRERVTAPEKQVQKPWEEQSISSLSFEAVRRPSDIAIVAEGLSKSFGGRTLFRDLSFCVAGRGRLVIAGSNGSGKTTLLRMLTGTQTLDAGTLRFGAHVEIGSVAQMLDQQFDYSKSPLELCGSSTNIRTLFACLKLPVTCLNRPLKELSGGERTKVALASILNSSANLLLLDEPTNHLEIEALEALEEALQRYPGAIIAVSHDAGFIEALGPEAVVIDLEEAVTMANY